MVVSKKLSPLFFFFPHPLACKTLFPWPGIEPMSSVKTLSPNHWTSREFPQKLNLKVTIWQIDGETVETVADFIFLGSKINADGDCSHEIKRRLFLGRKVMTNPDSILKSRDITLLTKSV